MGASSTTTREPSREDILRMLRSELPHLRERFGVVRLALFGSFARREQTAKSDVDLLVELSRPLGLEFVTLANYLEERLGHAVDLATFEAFRQASRKPLREGLAARIEGEMIDVDITSIRR